LEDLWLARRALPQRAPVRPTPEQLAEAGLIAAVSNVWLKVGEGEIFVIMGLSGCGKSTLVRCLSRLIEPTAGSVVFEGEDLLKVSKRQLRHLRRHKMGMVFQHFALFPHLSVLQNVTFPLDMRGAARGEREARAGQIVELVGLAGCEERLPRELSGGQQQRVGIARALVVEPDILFLDEPFSALDPLIRREMQDEFLRLQGQLKKTIVFITHDFDEATRLADRIAIMKDGEFIQVGTPEEIVTRPANDYVADFTRRVEHAKVITVRSIMAPVSAHEAVCGEVAASARVSEISAAVVSRKGIFAVVDDAGCLVGSLDREAVIRVLAGGATPR
jgi:glycine betaine/proline transport system ATP-binding protein